MFEILAVSAIGAQAATWYLQANAEGGSTDNWNTTSVWFSQPLGGGTTSTSISSSDNFDMNGYPSKKREDESRIVEDINSTCEPFSRFEKHSLLL
jgi:hypothetical protein